MESHSCSSSEDGAAQECPNPFIHELKLTKVQWIKSIILGCTLLPLRIILASVLMLIAWLAAWLRIVGLSEEERSKPLKGWRLWFFHPILWMLGRAVFFCVGFHWVKVKGRKADVKEAPIMVVAPHSSYLDMVIMFPGQVPSVVSRSENKNLPVIGALLECGQSIMVSRRDPDSRKKVISEVSQRVTSNGYWPQMLMFPEGTTTNGRCLLKFKHGAFVPGVPVQPVVLHYPNKLDTVRWTYKGSNWIQVLLYTLSQLYTNITIEFLPVYTPSEAEKKDPNLFANNVQKLMARTLGVPASDYVMVGRWPVRKLVDLSVPLESPARETVTLLCKSGLGAGEIEAALDLMIERCLSGAENTKVSAEELASILGLTDRQAAVHICGLYSKDKMVDLRCIYFNVAALTGHVDVNSLLHFAFSVFDTEKKGSLSKPELTALMGALLGVPQDSTEELYRTAANEGELTEENLLHALTTNTNYQKVTKECLQPEPIIPVANGTPVNNRHLLNGSVERSKSK